MTVPRDDKFFEEFYRANFQMLIGYAYRYIKNWDDAKEVTQDSFLVALNKIDQFYESGNRLVWIKSAIRKKAQNLNRVRTNHKTFTVPPGDPIRWPPTYDHYSGVDSTSAHCAELLTEKEFLLIRRIFMEGEPYPEVAKEYGLTEGACRKRVERILKKLRTKWGAYDSS